MIRRLRLWLGIGVVAAGLGGLAAVPQSVAQLVSAQAGVAAPRAATATSGEFRRAYRGKVRPAGSLPQTPQLPSAHNAAFRAEMATLWAGILANRVSLAMPAFFPEGAYAQVKAIADPAADWQDRLVGGYALDIAAAHALLHSTGGSAATRGAQLIAVDVPAGYAHWVPPNVCYNRIGYWETPNSRIVYRERGAVRSFGIASMISWRGVWYVVHLGAVLRPNSSEGVVDDPSVGRGHAAPSSTC